MKDACLNCQLPICNDKDARCAFVQIKRQTKKEYDAEYYQANKAKKIADAIQWRRDNIEKRRAYQRAYRRAKRDSAHDPASGVEISGHRS